MAKQNNRIKELRIEYRKSQIEVATLLGISQGAYSQIERGNTSLSIEQGLKLSRNYGITLDWLATGEGNRAAQNFKNGFIPLIDSRIHAGYIKKGSEVFEENIELYRIPGFTDGEYRIFEVEGTSMQPTLVPNDYLICSELKQPFNFVDGTICAVVTDGEIFVKRAYRDGNDGKKLIMKCDNNNFPSEKMLLKDIKELWAITAKLTTTFLTINEDHETRMKNLEEKLENLEKILSDGHMKPSHDGEMKPSHDGEMKSSHDGEMKPGHDGEMKPSADGHKPSMDGQE